LVGKGERLSEALISSSVKPLHSGRDGDLFKKGLAVSGGNLDSGVRSNPPLDTRLMGSVASSRSMHPKE